MADKNKSATAWTTAVSAVVPPATSITKTTPPPGNYDAEIAVRVRRQGIISANKILAGAGFFPRHIQFDPAKSRSAQWNAALEKLLQEAGTHPDFIVALIGLRGRGKTQLAACVAREIIGNKFVSKATGDFTTDAKGAWPRYVRALDMFIAIKKTFGDDAEQNEELVVRTFVTPELLVIDEAQERYNSTFEQITMTTVLDARYGHCRPTILIANLDKDKFQESVGPSIWSRLCECGFYMKCEWENFRNQNREEQ